MRRHLGSVGGLSLAALASSGSTYLLFVLYAQAGTRQALGEFVALYGLLLLVAQLLDGGSGLLMVRDVAQAQGRGEAAGIIRATLMRRIRGTAVALPVALVAGVLLFDSEPSTLAVTSGLLLALVLYGFTVQVLQAGQRFRELVALQCSNAALFVLLGVAVWGLVAEPGTAAMLGAPAVALAVLGVVGVPVVWRATRDAEQAAVGRSELRSVQLGAWGSAVAGNVDMVLLGAISPATTAVYAGAQRAALGVGAVSAALMSVLLPAVAGAEPESHRRVLQRATRLVAPVAVVGAGLGLASAPPLGWLYGDPSLAPPMVLAVLLAGFSIGALSNAPVAVLYARRRGAAVAALSLAQAVAIVAGCAVGAWLREPLIVAVGVATPRAFYLGGALLLARRAVG